MKKNSHCKKIIIMVLLIAAMVMNSSGALNPMNTSAYAENVISTADGSAITPETGMELYDLADFWLGCHVNINADNTFTVAFDYSA